ncbi:SDR family oxidoreductase [Devosia sp.]|uniref:SDR family oxidoreductase n=1 Tax=Devosia sp. TaxID=1871048 RepID=UPI002F07C6E9
MNGMRVIVTAGASGIGLAIAQTFLRAGARVHIGDVDGASLAAALAENPGLRGSVSDVSSSEDVDRLGDEALAWMGGVDVLVNNAGIGGPRGPVEEVEPAEWHQVMRVNLGGIFHTARRFVPVMKGQRAGCIINISTSSVRTGLPLRTPYVVSKAGVMGFTQNLAREIGPYNIRCNAILPGSIENERGRKLLRERAEREGVSYEQVLAQRLGYISMRSRITPEEVGEAALFLASPAARHISGQFLGVCGNVEWEE